MLARECPADHACDSNLSLTICGFSELTTIGFDERRDFIVRVCRPPAPENGGYRVHTDVSPVLAQTFTEPFVVYSAKRFPGVPGEHACILPLTIACSHMCVRYNRPLHCPG